MLLRLLCANDGDGSILTVFLAPAVDIRAVTHEGCMGKPHRSTSRFTFKKFDEWFLVTEILSYWDKRYEYTKTRTDTKGMIQCLSMSSNRTIWPDI